MPSDSVRILTFNIWNWSGGWSERRALLQRHLAQARADFSAFQEVLRGGDLDQLADLVRPGEAALYAAIGPFWDDSRYTWGVALTAARPVVRTRKIRLPGSVQSDTRVALSAESTIAGARVRITTTHLIYGSGTAGSRLAQATALARALDDGEMPALDVLCGDFNSVPGSRELLLLRAHGWSDAWVTCHGDSPGHTYTLDNPLVPRDASVGRIDYVLYRSTLFAPVACGLVGNRATAGQWASDHYGVAVEFSRREPA